MHTMTADYTSELQAKAEALKDTQTSLRALTRELSQARRTNAVLKAQNEKMPDLLLRIQSLESSLGLVGSLSSSSAAADDVSAEATNGSLMVIDSTLVTMGSSSSTATTTSTDDGETETKDGNQKNTMNNIDISQLSESEQITHLTQQIQQLRRLASTSHAALVAHRATDLKYKKIIATCANVPVSGVDGIVDVLLAALESDNDVHVNVPELAGFMARVRTAEVDINNNGGGGVGAVDEGNGA